MASDNEASCASDPNFAVICSFLECFGKSCGIVYPDIARLQEMLENTQEVPQELIDLHIKLLRKTRKTVSPEKWERALVKFCHSYSNQDGWELERFGYKKARIAVKLRLLKVLLETQFDLNQKFKNEVNKLAATELRVEPLGKDKCGLAYWCQLDEECNIRVYREDLDEENWELVAKDREGVVNLINTLSNGETGAIPINEDSNSLEISEKPIIDTGQVTTSPSLEDEAVQENGIHAEGLDEKELEKSGGEDFEDDQEQDNITDVHNDEEEMEEEDEVTNDESSKQNTEEDDSQEMLQNEVIESNNTDSSLISTPLLKALNGKVDTLPGKETVASHEISPRETVSSMMPDIKLIEARKVEDPLRTSHSKVDIEESMPIKSIETPVITSPLKLVNIPEMKPMHEEKNVPTVTPISSILSITKKHEDTTESVLKSLEKLSGKNNLSFSSGDLSTSHSKLPIKPIDQLAANLVRLQSEKLEKPSGAKSLEKIAENLARSGSMVGSIINGEDDRLPQDFCARSQTEKSNVLRGHRGMDLSTSPRGWESANEQNRPMDFSGIDLSSRKFNKTVDLPSHGYRTQDFQHREMDLSTKKLNKSEITNIPYDARTVMMRNHAMVADLSKRQMPFTTYEMSSTPYHNAARIPSKEDPRLPNYTILPDPSKITALRMSAAPVKRPLEGDDAQQDMLKRIRADVIPIRGSMDKRTIMSTNWREEIGESIEEPMMMVQGEGSGSDCDAVNPGLGEAIEEPIIFFYGEGSGEECKTGNPGDDTSADNKESNESKSEADSITASLSPSKNSTEGNLINEVMNKNTIKLNRNYPQSSVNVKGNCQIVGSTQEKPRFKPTLGIQIIPKNTTSGSVKRLSRWDVGKPEEKAECDSSIISNEGDISPKRNSYDNECRNTEQKNLLTDKQLLSRKNDDESSTSANEDTKIDGNSVSTDNAATEERDVVSENVEAVEENKSRTEHIQSPVMQDSVQCDSSILLCQADTSEAFESCTEAIPKTDSTNENDTIENACDSDNTISHEEGISGKVDNECKATPASPPRFFFGPNCVSYISKTEASVSQSDHTVSTTIHNKPDTLQYGCVSSSKPVEDMIIPYKTDDFDITQTNNNSLKVTSFGSESNSAMHEGPSNVWDQAASLKYSMEENYASPKDELGQSSSELKEEMEHLSSQLSTVQDPISSSENAKRNYLEPTRTEVFDAISQPHSTNDLSTTMDKENFDAKQESSIVEPFAVQSDLPVESEEDNIVEDKCCTFEEQSENRKFDVQENIDKTVETLSTCSEDETDCKSFATPIFKEDTAEKDSVSIENSCSSFLTKNSQSETEFEGGNNFTDLNPVAATEVSSYREVDSSAVQDVERVSDKYESFKKRESDSSGESCDKQSDRNDNFSECDGQEEQSFDTDNEKIKNLAGSDADSLYVNYDKNSERIDTLSDLGMQDEGSGDSEEMKEKNMIDSFSKDSASDVNVEADFANNSAVTSSESIQQCNKDTLVPTISSSDDACIQDTSSRESTEVQIGSEKSSVKDEYPIYNALPAIVPDTNTFKPSKSDTVETTKEVSLSNLVQTSGEYADDVSENRSSCIDQDSNEEMVIDDRLSESNESSKGPEETMINDVKPCSKHEALSSDKDTTDINCVLSESAVKENEINEIPETEEKEMFTYVDGERKSPDLASESVASDSNEKVQDSEDKIIEEIAESSNTEKEPSEETKLTADTIDDTCKKSKTEEPLSHHTDLTSTNSQESMSNNKQSLVANYDSSDSNDGSDDVFESDGTEKTEIKDKFNSQIERDVVVEEKESDKQNFHQGALKRQNNEILPVEVERTLTQEQTESKVQEIHTEDAACKENEINEEEIVKEEPTQREHSCNNNVQDDSSIKSVAECNKSKYKLETEIHNESDIDNCEIPGVTVLATTIDTAISPVPSGTSTENLNNQVGKCIGTEECIGTELIGTNKIIDDASENENKSSISVLDNVSNMTPVEVQDSKEADPIANEVDKPAQTRESTECNDINNHVTHILKSKEQHLKPMEEKLNTNLDKDSNFIKGKEVEEHLREELPIIQPYKKFKEFSELGNKENKFDVNLQEESHLNKDPLEGLDASVHSVSNILPLKLDNNMSIGIEKPQICKNDLVTLPDDNKSVDSLSFVNLAPEKSEDVNVVDNHGKYNETFNTINKIVFNAQETVPETVITKNDSKKEASKRLSDASDIQDVPPLKSKPPYTESDEQVDKNLTNSEVKLDEKVDNVKQIEASISETEVTDKLSDIHVSQITRDDSDTVSNLIDSISNESQQENNLESKDTKDISEIQSVEVKTVELASDDSMGVDNECLFNTAPEEVDPLAYTDDDALKRLSDGAQSDITPQKIGIRVKPVSELVYEGWKLDSTELPKISRKRRNSTHDSNSEDMGLKREDEEEMMGGKRIKLRGKRIPDKQLRRSVEESRVETISSEDEAVKCSTDKLGDQGNKDVSDDQSVIHSIVNERKTRGRPRGRRRRGYRGTGRPTRPKLSEYQGNQVPEISPSPVHVEVTPTKNDPSLDMTPTSQKKRKKRKMVLGLEIGRDIAPEVESGLAQGETPVRQSRRIAQLKIKEEADKRRIEEEALGETKEKDSTEKKKRKKQKQESEEEVIIKEIEKEKKSKKKRRKRKKKKMLAKFNEANPWQSSSGSSSDEENENDDEEEEEEELESEGSLLFKSDHEFSPESDLEKDQESEPLRRARTAQKAQSDVEEADDEYACQKCGKADHPEWILLCDSCDKGWHCSCLRPALMLIPEGDWFCPPCQHNLLVVKLRESLKTYDQLTKRHENEVLRKKRLAFVGISLDNVLHKSETQRHQKGSKASSQESDNESSSSSSTSSSDTSSSEESEPVYQLRERRCANTYKFNEYDDMINAAIQDEVEAVQGAGNQGRGKDIATIVNAEKEEAQLHFKNEVLNMEETQEDKDSNDRKSEKDSDEEYKVEGDDMDEEEEEQRGIPKKLLSRKKHRKLNSLDISSEDDPESDEDFKGTSSEDEEDFEDHLTSSDESTFANVKRRGKKGDARPVRRCTRARTTRYDEDFINDDSEESDRPKKKKSRSMWGDSDSEDSDNSWRQKKKKSKTIPTTRYRTLPKMKSKKKKKRKRIIEFDNQSDNDEEEESRIEEQCEMQPQLQDIDPTLHKVLDMKLDNNETEENIENDNDIKDVKLEEISATIPDLPAVRAMEEVVPQKKKKDDKPKPKKMPSIRRKIIYGGLPDESLKQEEEEILSRRTRGRKINYQEEMASDSEEELKKALRKTGESEDEFVVNEGEDINDDADKDSDSGDIYNPKKDGPKFKNKSPKNRKPRKSKSPGGKRKMMTDGTPKQRKKPGPKPGSKNKARKQQKFVMGSVIKTRDEQDSEKDVMAHVMDNPMGDLDSKIEDNLSENVGLTGTAISVAGSFTGDVPEGSLTGLGPGELADLDDEQLEQMMMEDEEYGRRQLELAAIEIAKKKKKEEREAKKLEKARLKALEILAAERQRDPNAPEGTDGEQPKKKKRGRRSKAEILAEQMRRDGAPNLNTASVPTTPTLTQNIVSNMSAAINPTIQTTITAEVERTNEGHIPIMTGPDGHIFSPDGSPMKPKRRGRGKGKKTLALEAARAAEAAAKAAAESGLLGVGTDSNPELKPNDIPNVLPTPGSSTSGSAPSTPPAGVVTTQGPPATQSPNSQSVYPSLPPGQQSSVITRMLQSQPVSSSPQSFTAAAAAMGHKYFGGPNAGSQIMAGPRTGYEMQPRGRIPSPYRQAGQSSMPPHFAAVRSGTPPMRMRVPGPQMYHTPHHPMDPSPSGGGPISINNRDRSSPLGPGPAMIPPAAGSPLAKGGPTPPPPPPYVRGGPPMSRFADNPMGPRHPMPPFTNASPANHNMQQPSPPPNRPPGNFSPYHPPPPPNYHYGAYPPPPPMSTADDAAAYQGSPYPAEHFSSPADNQPPIQAPPPPQPPSQQQGHPNDAGAGNKQYDEEGSGEFGGLVSYFSSQREDDLDS